MKSQRVGVVLLMVCVVGCGKEDRPLSEKNEELISTAQELKEQTRVEAGIGTPRPDQKQIVELLKSLGCDVLADSDGVINSIIVNDSPGSGDGTLMKIGNLSGLDSLQNLVIYDTSISDAGIEHISKLTTITYLALPSGITSAGIEKLTPLNRLQVLAFEGSITDEAIRQITLFEELRYLQLSRSTILDDHLRSIAALEKLENLLLDATAISDTGLKHLANCKSLKSVSVCRTSVTAAGVDELKMVLPGISVMFDEPAD